MFLCPRVFTQLAEDKRFQELVLILDPLLEENPWQLGSLLVTIQWDTNVTHVTFLGCAIHPTHNIKWGIGPPCGGALR